MGLVTGITLPNDGDRIKAVNYNDPISKIIAQMNGNLDSSNIASLSGAKISAGTIPQIALDSTNYSGWISGKTPPTSIVCNGNRSYTLTYAASILGYKSPGMRTRVVRGTTAPTQCTQLNGSTQYYSRTSANLGTTMTFTDDFVVSAWVKMTSYGTYTYIASRYNATSGWGFAIDASGRVQLFGANASSANFSNVTSYQSIPLNKWVHVSAQLDMSSFTATTTTSYIMIDGVDVPATVARAGTNPTALVQAGNLEIGSANGGSQFFPGKIAQVAIYNAKVTQANIRATISQGLSGTETSLISAYSFNNSINDLNTTSANNLTANGGVVATNADSPFCNNGTTNNTDYYITQLISADGLTETVQVPEGCTLPTAGTVTSIDFSTQKAPYGMPIQRSKWRLETINKTDTGLTGATAGVWTNISSVQLTLGVGEYVYGHETEVFVARGNSSGVLEVASTISTANNTESDAEMTSTHYTSGATSGVSFDMMIMHRREKPVSISSQTTCYLNIKLVTGSNIGIYGNSRAPIKVYADNAYL